VAQILGADQNFQIVLDNFGYYLNKSHPEELIKIFRELRESLMHEPFGNLCLLLKGRDF